MSEAGLITIVRMSDHDTLANTSSIGKVCPNVELKIIDENEDTLPANTEGQICVKSPQVCKQNKITVQYYY